MFSASNHRHSKIRAGEQLVAERGKKGEERRAKKGGKGEEKKEKEEEEKEFRKSLLQLNSIP